MSTTATWTSVSIGLPDGIQDALEKVNQILEHLSNLLEVISSILEVIKVFLVDILNPLKAILEALLIIVNNLINDLRQTGLYLYADLPSSNVDHEYAKNLKGGMSAWRGRMAYALLSPNVQNRPAFSNTASVISFHFVVTAGDIGAFIAQFGFLLAMFKQKAKADFNPPQNVQVRPINKDFYNTYYDVDTGLLIEDRIADKQSEVLSSGLSASFMTGKSEVSAETVELGIRYDFLTGEEFVIDVASGSILTNSGTPDATLITWKSDHKLLPQNFRIERTTVQGGEPLTETVNGIVEVVRDSEGDPIIVFPTLVEKKIKLGFGLNEYTGSAISQVAYLDETVEPGQTYWYRVVAVYGSGLAAKLPSFDGTHPVVQRLMNMLRSILKATTGEAMSPLKGVYIPNQSDGDLVRNLALQASMDNQHWMQTFHGPGWNKVGVGDLFEPIIMAVEELRNFVEMLLASVSGIIEQIVAFIELLQARIDALNTFIEILQAIIETLKVFELLSFGLLFVTTDEGTSGVLQAINNTAIEGVPQPGESDYVGSITVLGGTAGVGAALNAMKLILGIE